MKQAEASSFSYVAFNFIAGGIIGHGYSAFHAAQMADRNDPSATIKIIYVGYIGALLWGAQLSMQESCELAMQLLGMGDLKPEMSGDAGLSSGWHERKQVFFGI